MERIAKKLLLAILEMEKRGIFFLSSDSKGCPHNIEKGNIHLYYLAMALWLGIIPVLSITTPPPKGRKFPTRARKVSYKYYRNEMIIASGTQVNCIFTIIKNAKCQGEREGEMQV